MPQFDQVSITAFYKDFGVPGEENQRIAFLKELDEKIKNKKTPEVKDLLKGCLICFNFDKITNSLENTSKALKYLAIAKEFLGRLPPDVKQYDGNIPTHLNHLYSVLEFIITSKNETLQKIDYEKEQSDYQRVCLALLRLELYKTYTPDATSENKPADEDKEVKNSEKKKTPEDYLRAIFQLPVNNAFACQEIRNQAIRACYEAYQSAKSNYQKQSESKTKAKKPLTEDMVAYLKNLYLIYLEKKIELDWKVDAVGKTDFFKLTDFQQSFPEAKADESTIKLIQSIQDCYFCHLSKKEFNDYVDEMATEENGEARADVFLASFRTLEKSDTKSRVRVARFYFTHEDPYKALAVLKSIDEKSLKPESKDSQNQSDNLECYINVLVWMAEQNFLPAKIELQICYCNIYLPKHLFDRVDEIVRNPVNFPKTKQDRIYYANFWANTAPAQIQKEFSSKNKVQVKTESKTNGLQNLSNECTTLNLPDKYHQTVRLSTKFTTSNNQIFDAAEFPNFAHLYQEALFLNNRVIQNACFEMLNTIMPKFYNRNLMNEVYENHPKMLKAELTLRRAVYCLKKGKYDLALNYCQTVIDLRPLELRPIDVHLLKGTIVYQKNSQSNSCDQYFRAYQNEFLNRDSLTDKEINTLYEMVKFGFKLNPFVPDYSLKGKISFNDDDRSTFLQILFDHATKPTPNPTALQRFNDLNTKNNVAIILENGNTMKLKYQDQPKEIKQTQNDDAFGVVDSILGNAYFLNQYRPDPNNNKDRSINEQLQKALSQYGVTYILDVKKLMELKMLIPRVCFPQQPQIVCRY